MSLELNKAITKVFLLTMILCPEGLAQESTKEQVAIRYFKNRDFTTASKEAREILQRDPQNVNAWLVLGGCRYQAQDFTGASDVYTAGFNLTGNKELKVQADEIANIIYERARFQSVQAYFNGDLNKARIHAFDAQKAKDTAEIHLLLEKVYTQEGKLQAAEVEKEKAWSIDPSLKTKERIKEMKLKELWKRHDPNLGDENPS